MFGNERASEEIDLAASALHEVQVDQIALLRAGR
jgi:hypothetical protein